ncbi:ERCC4 domain-containing protein [bacterium]|nr:ERCC4 domain-containing protein [bacterium]
MILCDSREKWTQPGSRDTHISGYFDRHGIAYRVEKLDVGDYMLDGGSVTVDRKQNLEEICKNLTNPADRKRFFAEARRAKELGLKLVVLIESNKYHQPRDILAWRSKYSHVPGTAVYRQMEKLRLAYKVEFRFCPKVSAARKIVEILEGDQK